MRDFQDVLTDLDDGSVHEQLTEQLAALVQAVNETKKAGAITLTLNVKREGGMAVVKADVKTKMPQSATNATMFYATEDGELTREDPRQLTLRQVQDQVPIRQVGQRVPVREDSK